MAKFRILITGGAGFIGSHLTHELFLQGHELVILDNLDPQVHNPSGKSSTHIPPKNLPSTIKFVYGNIQDYDKVKSIVENVDIVYHLAAKVGVAQSMYAIAPFISSNSYGTSVLLDALANTNHNVRQLIVASSMAVYGEGAYLCKDHGKVYPDYRESSDIKENSSNHKWELYCPYCENQLAPIPTSESKPFNCSTFYAQSKRHQEEMCLLLGKTYGIPTTALRFFGTYGSHQALSNPYTGVCAIFATALIAGNSPLIYEDGYQSRDLVHVSDVIQALNLCLDNSSAKNEIFNVGTGSSISILDVAKTLQQHLQVSKNPEILNKFRAGDVRHIIADISKIKEKLGYQPKVSFKSGIKEFVSWIQSELGSLSINDRASDAYHSLKRKNLL